MPVKFSVWMRKVGRGQVGEVGDCGALPFEHHAAAHAQHPLRHDAIGGDLLRRRRLWRIVPGTRGTSSWRGRLVAHHEAHVHVGLLEPAFACLPADLAVVIRIESLADSHSEILELGDEWLAFRRRLHDRESCWASSMA